MALNRSSSVAVRRHRSLIAGADAGAERPSSQGRMMLSMSIKRLRWSDDSEIGFTRLPSRSSTNDPFSSLMRRRPGSSTLLASGVAGGGEGCSFLSCPSSAFRFLYP
jgi:hypothetical protein